MNNVEFQLVIKRGFDIVASSIALLILSPFFLIIMSMIVIDSNGSPIFLQRRLGLNGKTFSICKFRTMHSGSDRSAKRSADGANLLAKGDPRVTRLGRLLREFSVDELPQLWNVFKGDMSIVGPRPDEEKAILLYEEWEKKKLSMRPGITGLAMIKGRNALEWRRRIQLDIEYCARFSLWLDVVIIVKTVKVVLCRDGVYNPSSS